MREIEAKERGNAEIQFEKVNKIGKPLDVYENYVKVFAEDGFFEGILFHNLLTGRDETQKGIPLSDVDEIKIRMYLEKVYGLQGEKRLERSLKYICSEHSYHPIREMIEGFEWDGVPRLDKIFVKYLGADDSEYTRQVTRMLFSGTLNRLYKPGCKFDYMIVFVDEKQGGGKSSMCRLLALKDEWHTDFLRSQLNDEKIFEDFRGKWIVEVAELLATSNKKSVEEIKAFISRSSDNYRTPYDKYSVSHPRQCVFIGTTNSLDFLPKDRTGNRRFVPLRTRKELAEIHPLEDEEETRQYIQQCYAEAMSLYKAGDLSLSFDRSFENDIEQIRQEFSQDDVRAGVIAVYLEKHDAVCTRQLYEEAFKLYGVPDNYMSREIASIMNTMPGWKRVASRNFGRYGKQRGWIREAADDKTQDFSPFG